MLVFWEQRLVVLAMPKAGSTAVATALESLASLSVQRPDALKHTSARDYDRFVRPFLESAASDQFTVVALMREPQEWLGSWYRFYQKDDFADGPLSTRSMNFDQFVQSWCSDAPPVFAAFGTQSDFLIPGQYHGGLDRLFRYADMTQFVRFLEDRLQCEIILPQVNVSPLALLALSPSTTAMMQQRAAGDIALYAAIATSNAVRLAP